MVGYIEKSAGGDFTPTPAGVHLMICSQVIDLGTQPGSQMYPAPKRKVMIRWEVPNERVEIDGKDLPAIHSEKYTWSFHENANLRDMLESWRGKTFVEDDFAGPPNGFHIKNLLGVPMMGQVFHESKGDKTYANLKTAMPAGIKKPEWPALEGPSYFFDLDDFNQEVFDQLSDYYKTTIQGSPEYQKLFGSNQHSQQSENPGAGMQHADLDDEIPF